jgi:hypothetical protein
VQEISAENGSTTRIEEIDDHLVIEDLKRQKMVSILILSHAFNYSVFIIWHFTIILLPYCCF